MRRKHVVLFAGLAVAIAIPAALLLHKERRERGLADFLADEGFVKQSSCSVKDAIVERPSEVVCHRGVIKEIPATVLLVARSRPGFVPNTSQVALDQYAGIWFDFDAEPPWFSIWFESWQRKVASRGDGWSERMPPEIVRTTRIRDGSEALPIRATVFRSDEGLSVLLGWSGIWSSDIAKARLREVEASIEAI